MEVCVRSTGRSSQPSASLMQRVANSATQPSVAPPPVTALCPTSVALQPTASALAANAVAPADFGAAGLIQYPPAANQVQAAAQPYGLYQPTALAAVLGPAYGKDRTTCFSLFTSVANLADLFMISVQFCEDHIAVNHLIR